MTPQEFPCQNVPRAREQLAEAELHVQDCLGGRLRDFRLLFENGGLVLLGRTKTYHAKQLAQHAVMRASAFPIMANDIEVY